MDTMQIENVTVAEREETVKDMMPANHSQRIISLPMEEVSFAHIDTVDTQKKEMIDRKEQIQSRRGYWMLRRGQDIFFSLFALIVLFPILMIIAIVIYIDDPKGSPIFSQIRCGRDGKEFKFYKFRSMCINAEDKLDELLENNEMDGPVFKIKDDPRITRVGRFIRKTSLDELPQLWNIVKGDMSIVGPRPALPREVERYTDYQKQRMYVTPGLTCYWQIQPNRNQIGFDEWIDMDIQYIKERSFFVDWKIIFLTIGAVLRGSGE